MGRPMAGALSRVTCAAIRPSVSKRRSRRQHGAERGKARAQSAVEEDQRQRDGADGINEPDILEMDAERPGFARQHADDTEDQQQRPAETQGDKARQDAGQHQKCAEQDQKTDRIE